MAQVPQNPAPGQVDAIVDQGAPGQDPPAVAAQADIPGNQAAVDNAPNVPAQAAPNVPEVRIASLSQFSGVSSASAVLPVSLRLHCISLRVVFLLFG